MIQLKFNCDYKFYMKMKQHKAKLEMESGKRIIWDEYIKILLGMAE